MPDNEYFDGLGDEGLRSHVIAIFSEADGSAYSDVCYTRCSPDRVVNSAGRNATFQYILEQTVTSEGAKEAVIDILVVCPGPKKRFLLFGEVCGANITTSITEVTE